MVQAPKKHKISPTSKTGQAAPGPGKRFAGYAKAYWRRNWFHKLVVILVVIIALSVATMYGIARWYMWSQAGKPYQVGASFIPAYARSLGVDPQQTLNAMLDELNVKHLRYVGYWSDIERAPGHYDFSELDWQFKAANEHQAKVSLSIGLRQPRWPECHMPEFLKNQPKSVWQPQLNTFITAVVERYKDNPALDSYQLENEFFLSVFGECPDFDRSRLVSEYDMVKRLDPAHPVIVSRSNNAIGTPIYAPVPDMYAVSVYKRVWVPIVGRYVEYPFPAWFYAFLAGTEKIIQGRDTIIHELQAEPWPPRSVSIPQASLAEQSKSLNAERLRGRFTYGKATGMRHIDLWGAEYWYYRKQVLHDPSVWDAAKDEYRKVQ